MKRTLFFIAVVVLLTGCADRIFDIPQLTAEDGKGIVIIDFGGSARTLLPSKFDISGLYFTFTFTPQNGGEEITGTLDQESEIAIQLAAGVWNLDVKGYASELDAADPSKALAYCTKNGIEVLPGSAETINREPLKTLDNVR